MTATLRVETSAPPRLLLPTLDQHAYDSAAHDWDFLLGGRPMRASCRPAHLRPWLFMSASLQVGASNDRVPKSLALLRWKVHAV